MPRFCTYLLEDLNFEPAALQPCCAVRNATVPTFAYTGGPVDMPAYRRHIRQTFDALQGEGELCRGCPHLQDATGVFPADIGNYVRFRTLSINHHRFLCNCRCIYCSLWQGKGEVKPYGILPGLKSLAKQNALHPDCFISWGGGESSLLPEFETACTWAWEQGFTQYVHTNAIHFSPATAALLATGKGGINISLDAGSASTYHAIKGKDAWRDVLSNLARYLRACVTLKQIEVKYILFETNNSISELERFFRICAEIGIRCLHYSLDFREVNAGKVSPKTLLAAAYFANRAKSLGFTTNSFFIDADLKERINTLEKQHFSQPIAAQSVFNQRIRPDCRP